MKIKFQHLFILAILSFVSTSWLLMDEKPTGEEEEIELLIVRAPILKSSHGSFYATFNSVTLTVDVEYYRGAVVIEIIDTPGNLALSSAFYVDGFGSQTLNVSTLEPGDYLLRIVAGGVVYEGNFHIPDE